MPPLQPLHVLCPGTPGKCISTSTTPIAPFSNAKPAWLRTPRSLQCQVLQWVISLSGEQDPLQDPRGEDTPWITIVTEVKLFPYSAFFGCFPKGSAAALAQRSEAERACGVGGWGRCTVQCGAGCFASRIYVLQPIQWIRKVLYLKVK